MINAKPRLYYSTGLRAGNVIDDPAKMNTWNYIDLDDHIGLQDFFLDTIRVKVDWDTIKNADYMKYGDAYYWIIPRMINENCAEIFCQLDALTSIGGPLAQEYVAGTLRRAHPLNRTSLDNIIEDDCKPSNILRAITHPINFLSGSSDNITLIASTVKLDDDTVSLSPSVEHDALVFSGQVGLTADDKYTIAIPKAPAPSTPTMIQAFNGDFNTVGFGLYDADNATVKKNLEYLRSLGLSDAILFSYTIPKATASIVRENNHGKIGSLSGTHDPTANSPWIHTLGVSLRYTAGLRNLNFAKSYMTERRFVIRGRLSGDIKEFRAYEIYNPSGVGGTIDFGYATDPAYQGTTYCSPEYYYGSTDIFTRIANSAKGLPWQDTPISIGGATGSRWAWNQRALNLSENGILGVSSLGEATQLAGRGLATNAMGIYTTTLGAIMDGLHIPHGKAAANMDPRQYEEAKNNMQYAQSLVQTPQLTTSPAFGLQNYMNNTFDVIELRPTDDDILRIDKFYAEYGYKMPNIPFNKSYLSSMPDWNYIEGNDIKISPTVHANFGKSIVEAAEGQLNAGCKIWHRRPSHGYTNI